MFGNGKALADKTLPLFDLWAVRKLDSAFAVRNFP